MIICIAGTSASGKTLVANELAKRLKNSYVLSMDRYFLTEKEIESKGLEYKWDDPRSLDWELLNRNIEELIGKGKALVPIYDFFNERTGFEEVQMPETLIIEGLWALSDRLKVKADLSIFIDAEPDERLARRLERDSIERGKSVEKLLRWWRGRIRPGEKKYVLPTKKEADILFHNAPVSKVVEQIEHALKKGSFGRFL